MSLILNVVLLIKYLFRYGTGTLTSVFLDRVFQECLTYDGEMDYKTYLDFVLAMENRKEPQALQYLFRLLDVQNKGVLNMFDLNFFFRVTQKSFTYCKHSFDKVNTEACTIKASELIEPLQLSLNMRHRFILFF